MGFVEKMSKTFGFRDDDEDKELETRDKDDTPVEPKEPPAPEYTSRKIIGFNPTGSENAGNEAMPQDVVRTKITTIKPKDFSDAQTVANCLRESVPVVVNFEDTDRNEAKRIIDFISGTTYAIDGEIKKVSEDVFICAPENVTVESSTDDRRPISKLID